MFGFQLCVWPNTGAAVVWRGFKGLKRKYLTLLVCPDGILREKTNLFHRFLQLFQALLYHCFIVRDILKSPEDAPRTIDFFFVISAVLDLWGSLYCKAFYMFCFSTNFFARGPTQSSTVMGFDLILRIKVNKSTRIGNLWLKLLPFTDVYSEVELLLRSRPDSLQTAEKCQITLLIS